MSKLTFDTDTADSICDEHSGIAVDVYSIRFMFTVLIDDDNEVSSRLGKPITRYNR